MNIFFLHKNTRKCARYHVDKHVIKMILETCQLLCTAWHTIDPDHRIFTPAYRPTHKNHPCAVWARHSQANYVWLCTLGRRLCKEYTHRYGKVHKTEPILKLLSRHVPPIPMSSFTTPPQCMPDNYKHANSVIAYRKYYCKDKIKLHAWKHRSVPHFVKKFVDIYSGSI